MIFRVILFSFLLIALLESLQKEIYVFGDSHTEEFIGIPHCNRINVGSITMHRAGRDSLDFIDFSSYQIAEGDAIVFVFGQIDIGWHICKIKDSQMRTLNEIIHTLADKYIQAIQQATQCLPKTIKIIYSVTPPSNNTNIPHIPYVGSLNERVQISRQLNALLKQMSISAGIEFLDVYDAYSDPNGVLRTELSDKSHHILHFYNQVIQQRLYEILDKYP